METRYQELREKYLNYTLTAKESKELKAIKKILFKGTITFKSIQRKQEKELQQAGFIS